MVYLFLYAIGLIAIWYIYRVGWIVALKTIISIIIPSLLIILFNLKAGRFIFRNPVFGIVSSFPTAILIFRGSKPLVSFINNSIDKNINDNIDSEDVIETESVPLDK